MSVGGRGEAEPGHDSAFWIWSEVTESSGSRGALTWKTWSVVSRVVVGVLVVWCVVCGVVGGWWWRGGVVSGWCGVVVLWLCGGVVWRCGGGMVTMIMI